MNTNRTVVDSHGSVLGLLTTEELAHELGVNKGTVENWRYSGHGPSFIHTGAGKGRVRYRIIDVNAWLESKVTQPAAPLDPQTT